MGWLPWLVGALVLLGGLTAIDLAFYRDDIHDEAHEEESHADDVIDETGEAEDHSEDADAESLDDAEAGDTQAEDDH